MAALTRRCLAAVVVLVGTTLAAPPAMADAGSTDLERGDAPAPIDLTRLVVHNGESRFTMRVDVPGLAARGQVVFQYWRGRHQTPPGRSLLVTVRTVAGETSARFLSCGREDCVRDGCRGLRATWDAAGATVVVSAPQRCYPTSRASGLPVVGRFFVWSRMGAAYDEGNPEPLLLVRGPRS